MNGIERKIKVILAVSLVLLASWTIGGILQTTPDLTVIEEEPVDEVDGNETEWIIKGGDLFSLLLNTLFAMIIGILSGSIMSLMVIKKSELIGKIYAIAIIALALATILYLDVDEGLPSVFRGGGGLSDWFDFSSLTVRGVTIGIISLLGIVLLILIILSINAFIGRSSKKVTDESLVQDPLKKDKEEAVEDITETVGKAVKELSRGDDIREVIIRVYQQMCGLFERGGMRNEDSMTPRELEYLAMRSFDIDRKVIGDITKTFEEARYSKHRLREVDRERVLREFKGLKKEFEDMI
ncbi:MAG: DUF4129 domain-containing protein [Candidatus Saliniplasma sp.]